MGSLIKQDIELLISYLREKKYIIEIGSGRSTKLISRNIKDDTVFYSINLFPISKINKLKNVRYKIGWLIKYEDFILPKDKDFVKASYNNLPDGDVVFKGKSFMKGECDLLRKIITEQGRGPDVFFCDSGEYSALPEWKIIKPYMVKNSIVAFHNIYHEKQQYYFLSYKVL